MIFRYQVEEHSKKYLETTLAKVPSVLRLIKRDPEWTQWIDRLTHRCNELDTLGYVPSKWAMYDFIDKANAYYAHKILDKVDAIQSVQGTDSGSQVSS